MAMSATAAGRSRSLHILDVARRLLVEEGLDNFVMRRIAEMCAMKLGNLQYYFSTRDDLLEAIARAEIAQDVDVITDDALGFEAEQRLANGIKLLAERWVISEGSVYIPIGALALHNERFAKLWAEIYGQFYAALDALIGEIDKTADAAQLRRRTMLITSLVDGASIQAFATDQQLIKLDFSHDIQRLAIAIAKGA